MNKSIQYEQKVGLNTLRSNYCWNEYKTYKYTNIQTKPETET